MNLQQPQQFEDRVAVRVPILKWYLIVTLILLFIPGVIMLVLLPDIVSPHSTISFALEPSSLPVYLVALGVCVINLGMVIFLFVTKSVSAASAVLTALLILSTVGVTSSIGAAYKYDGITVDDVPGLVFSGLLLYFLVATRRAVRNLL